MAKKNPFGNTPEEIQANIAKMKKEREELAKRAGTPGFKRKDNKRFNELSRNISDADKTLRSFTQNVAEEQTPQDQQPFTEKKTEVVMKKDSDAGTPQVGDDRQKRILDGAHPSNVKRFNEAKTDEERNKLLNIMEKNAAYLAEQKRLRPEREASGMLINQKSDIQDPVSEQPVSDQPQQSQPQTGGILPDPTDPGITTAGTMGDQGQEVAGINPTQGFQGAFGGDQALPDPTTAGIQPVQTPTQEDIANQVLGGREKDGSPLGDEITKSVLGPQGQQRGRRGLGAKQPMVTSMTAADVSAGIDDPILKGTVTGRFMGSTPIFVGGGGYSPVHLVAQRRKELQDAAKKRQEETNALLSQKPPLVKDQRFQGSLNTQFNNVKEAYIAKAQKEYGADWDMALKDQSNPIGREFVNALSNFDHIAGQADQVTALIGEIDADLKSGDRVFSDATLGIRDEYNKLMGDFLRGDIDGMANLQDKYDQLIGFTSLDKILTDQDFDIDGQITQIASLYEEDEIFGVNSVKRKEFEDQVRVIAKGLADNQMRDAVMKEHITEDEIFDRILARHGSEYIQTKTASQKRKDGAVKVEVDLGTDFGNPKDENIGGQDYRVTESVEVPSGAPSLNITGVDMLNADGTTTSIKGANDYRVNSFQVVQVPDPDNPGEKKNVKVAAATYTQEAIVNNKKVEVETTILVPLEEHESRMKTDLLKEGQWEAINAKLDAKANEAAPFTPGGGDRKKGG